MCARYPGFNHVWGLWAYLTAAAVIAAGGCSAGPGAGGGGARDRGPCIAVGERCAEDEPFGEDTFTYDVTYQDNARVISEATVENSLIAISDDGSEYRFRTGADDVAGLTVGEVALFSGHSVRRVTEVRDSGRETVIRTEDATLEELIEEGTIGWEQIVGFEDFPDGQVDADYTEVFGAKVAAGTAWSRHGTPASAKLVEFSGQIEGWDTTFEVEPADDRLNVVVSFSRSVAGTPVVAVRGEGWISPFRQRTRLNFAGGRLTDAEVQARDLRGEMEITWAAANQGEFIGTDATFLNIPVGFPLVVPAGPIPMTVWLKAGARVSAQLRFANMSSRGSMKVQYDSSQGFSLDGGSFNPIGSLGSREFSVTGETVSAGPATVGFGASIEFPRLELSVLGSATAYVSVDASVAGFYEPGLFSGRQACQWGEITLRAIAGYELSLLGVLTVLSDSHELWRDKHVRYAGGEPCD